MQVQVRVQVGVQVGVQVRVQVRVGVQVHLLDIGPARHFRVVVADAHARAVLVAQVRFHERRAVAVVRCHRQPDHVRAVNRPAAAKRPHGRARTGNVVAGSDDAGSEERGPGLPVCVCACVCACVCVLVTKAGQNKQKTHFSPKQTKRRQ